MAPSIEIKIGTAAFEFFCDKAGYHLEYVPDPTLPDLFAGFGPTSLPNEPPLNANQLSTKMFAAVCQEYRHACAR